MIDSIALIVGQIVLIMGGMIVLGIITILLLAIWLAILDRTPYFSHYCMHRKQFLQYLKTYKVLDENPPELYCKDPGEDKSWIIKK